MYLYRKGIPTAREDELIKNLWALGAVSIAAAGCGPMSFDFGGPQVQGSGKVKTESRSVPNFTKIQSHGSANCEVTVGPAVSVKITADDNILPMVKTRVEDGALIISTEGRFSSKSGIRAVVTVPNLAGFSISGSGDAKIKGVRGSRFDVAISGSGDIDGQGQADSVDAAISGSGDIDLSSLRSRTASASIAGSGDIRLNVADSLSAAIQGSGSITYLGNPRVSKSIAGSGSVAKG